ncbi:MAG: PAS domain S-box protein [Anaerolineae bacterium]|nr:PAS domain S-box protein [Anaerolineae bacterium]
MAHIEARPSSADDPAEAIHVPVVGVGASAGGLAAYQELLSHTPPDTGMAFVLVQHLDPDRNSLMPELLQRYTRMPVTQAEDGIVVEPNHVYTIPPNAELALVHGRLRLLPLPAERGARQPIDTFFRSLAADRQTEAIGVVLSGAGSDGTLGLREIKDAGGLTLAQDPDVAAYGAMPRSAIRAGVADYVLPPADMVAQLTGYVRYARAAGPALSEAGDHLQSLVAVLREQTGHDFSLYKENTLSRRVERRMALAQTVALSEYVRHVQADPSEAQALFEELLIGVTSFFRDPAAFQALEEKVLSELLPDSAREGPEPGRPLRIWVPGCSTGEEAYSIAILVRERLEALGRLLPVQIFATDIDAAAISAARTAIYPESIAADVGQARLQRYFVEVDGGYRVSQPVREMMVFSLQNLAQDPPFSQLDLVSCRNLLIYMKPELQRRVGALLHYALRSGGFLFLGSSESLGEAAPHFKLVDKKWRIYRRLPGEAQPRAARFSAPHLSSAPVGTKLNVQPPPTPRSFLESYLLASHTPPCVVVNESWELQYVHGHTGRYLEPAAGEVTTNVLRMARPGLRIPLTAALHRAQQQLEQVVLEPVGVQTEAGDASIRLIVQPVSEPAALQGMMVIIFEDLPPTPAVALLGENGPVPEGRLAVLEHELSATRQYLQATVEQLEASNQQLGATNDELQSSNEELQSANEELQTAKEELQSVNEELLTVNAELEAKLEELSETNADLDNLFAAIDVGAVLLDLELRIRRFTPMARRVISLIDSDVGRPIGHTVCHLRSVDLVDVARTVLATLETQEREVSHADGGWLWMRARPYRTPDYAVQGVTLTFHDITQLKETQHALEAARDRLEQAVRERTAELSRARSRLALAVRGSGGGLWYTEFDEDQDDALSDRFYISPELKALVGYRDDELPNSLAAWRSRVLPEDLAAIDAAGAAYRAGERDEYDVRYRIRHRDGSIRWFHTRGEIEYDAEGRPVTWAGIDWDETDAVIQEVALRESEARFRALFQRIGSGVAVYSTPDGGETFVIRDINPAGERYSHVRREDIVGRPVDEVFPNVSDIGLLDVLRHVWQTGEPEHLPLTRYTDERIDQWVENYVYRLPSGEVVAVYEDVTEREEALATARAAAARFEALLQAACRGVWQVDGAGRTVMVNKAMAELLGYTPEEMKGRPIGDFVQPAQADAAMALLTRPALDEVAHDRVTLRHKDGGDVVCAMSVSPVLSAEGQPASVITVVSAAAAGPDQETDDLRARTVP